MRLLDTRLLDASKPSTLSFILGVAAQRAALSQPKLRKKAQGAVVSQPRVSTLSPQGAAGEPWVGDLNSNTRPEGALYFPVPLQGTDRFMHKFPGLARLRRAHPGL